MTARRVLLDGLARDADIFELVSELAPLHPRDNTFPGEVFLRLAADALNWCGASRADPLPLEGLRERFLPESTFRGRQNTKLQYAVLVSRRIASYARLAARPSAPAAGRRSSGSGRVATRTAASHPA